MPAALFGGKAEIHGKAGENRNRPASERARFEAPMGYRLNCLLIEAEAERPGDTHIARQAIGLDDATYDDRAFQPCQTGFRRIAWLGPSGNDWRDDSVPDAVSTARKRQIVGRAGGRLGDLSTALETEERGGFNRGSGRVVARLDPENEPPARSV